MDQSSHFEIIDSVVETWEEIKKIPDYEGVAGTLLFKKIFELAPDAVQLFSFGQRASSLTASSPELYENALFQRHARSVVKMLDTALSMLGPDLEPLKQALRSLGGRHVDYGVLPAHYEVVGEALLATLEAALGINKWNNQVKHGWANIYHIVSTCMLEGANQRMQAEQQDREIKKQQEQQEKQDASVTAYAKPPRATAEVISSDVHHVRDSWEIIKKIPNYADVAGVILFQRIFELAPGALPMFSFANNNSNNNVEALLKHPLFLRHARGVVSMLDTAISLLGNVEPLLQALGELGARHVEYGVLPAHYPIVGDALLYTLQTALGDEYWNDQVKAGWVRIYGAVSTGMLTGAHRRIQQEQQARQVKADKVAQRTAAISAYNAHKEVVPLAPGEAPPEEVNHVKESWEAIKQEIPNYAEVAGAILFRKIFELAPAAMNLFAFTKSFSADSDELYKNPLFLRHARGVVQMLDTAVNMLGPDLNPLHKALYDLGARHIEYGVLPAHYPIVGQALLYTLQTALGATRWTPDVEQGWTSIYAVVSSSMLQGAHRRLHMENRARDKSNLEAQQQQHCANKKASEVVPLPPGVAPAKQQRHQQGVDTGITLQAKKAEDIRSSVRQLRLQRKQASMISLQDSPSKVGDKISGILDNALNITLSNGGGLSTIASKMKIPSNGRDNTRSNKSPISFSINSRANRHLS